MPAKPTIFISHISEEAEIAGIFKREIEAQFLGMIDIFVSSDATSLRLGRNWLSDITAALRNCRAILIFCSPYSIGRPWINFECGAGWARDIEIAPLCHSGLRPVDLPLPISLLQGIEAADPNKIVQVFQLIADKLGSQIPAIDHARIASQVKEFENRYTEEMQMVRHLQRIKTSCRELFNYLSQLVPMCTTMIESVPERMFAKISSDLDALQHQNMLSYNFAVVGIAFGAPGTSGGGNFGTLTISVVPRLAEVIQALSSTP